MKRICLTIIILAFSLTAHSTTIRSVLEKYDLCEYRSVFIDQGKNGFHFLTVVLPGGMYSAIAIVGSYVGKNYGMILEITENDFLIVELVQNENGDWEEKHTRITVENHSIAQHCGKIDKYDKSLNEDEP
jgi:type IV pilus assembly protein PilP